LRRLILELAVVHDLADRWSGVWRNLDKVEIGIRGDAEGIFDTHDAYLLPSWADQTDFRYADAFVDAGLSADGASWARRPGCSSGRYAARIVTGRLMFSYRHRHLARSGFSGGNTTPSAKRPCVSRARCRPVTAEAARLTQNRHTAGVPVTGPLSLATIS
jgi:hypothetical protein